MKSIVVLVIDDEPLILMDIEAALVEEGFEVVTANNGTRAIEAFDADPSLIDGVVSDINLGNSPSGWDVDFHRELTR